jgi:hypothetical protein
MTQISTRTQIASIRQILQLLSCHFKLVIHWNFLLCRAKPLRASGILHSDKSQISIKISYRTVTLKWQLGVGILRKGGVGWDLICRAEAGGKERGWREAFDWCATPDSLFNKT